jgi:methyl-accepting chemotaxis protein
VNRAVMQMDELTQQNAALVEQATAASQAMAEQARELNEMMARYVVDAAAEAAMTMRSKPVVKSEAASQPRAERRSAKRPWSDRTTKAAAPAPAASPQVAEPAPRKVANGSDSDWTEF